MSKNAEVLAVQLPAICPLHCRFCRTPDHGEGDPDAVFLKVAEEIPWCKELYLTSNGETGLSSIFTSIIGIARNFGIKVSVLCATEKSVVPGLCRVEVSLNEYTRPLALRAFKKARELDIPLVISIVSEINGQNQNIHLEEVANEHNADGVILRPLQMEGRSSRAIGTTRVYQRPGSNLGFFPVSAYAELVGYGEAATCIDHFGRIVPLLGSP